MTSFKSDGFLSSDIAGFEADISAKYKAKLDLAREANEAAHTIIYSADIHNEHLPDLLLATLLARQTGSFQGFLILIQKGLLAQAQILLRNLAETMFIVGAVGKDNAFASSYVLSDEISRKKSLEALVRDAQRRGKDVDQATKDLIAELATKIKDEGIAKFSTWQIAEKAGLESYYDSLYRFTSMAVHTSTRGLDKTLEVDKDGKVIAVHYKPEVDDLDMYLDYGISMMLHSLHEIATNFELAVDGIEALQKKNQELAGEAAEDG